MSRQDITKKIKEAIPDTWNCLFGLCNLVVEELRNWKDVSFNFPTTQFHISAMFRSPNGIFVHPENAHIVLVLKLS